MLVSSINSSIKYLVNVSAIFTMLLFIHTYYIDGLVYNYGNSVYENVGLGNGG